MIGEVELPPTPADSGSAAGPIYVPDLSAVATYAHATEQHPTIILVCFVW